MIRTQCHVCSGKKIVKGMEELTIYVEKGMSGGQEIVITN
jgi:DnaJ-class molecular chaperone